MYKLLVLLGVAVALVGCSAVKQTVGIPTQSLNNVAYTVLSDSSLVNGGTNVSGNGTIIFNAPLSSISSGHSYALTFTLQNNGSLTLASHSSNALANAFSVKFLREGSVLKVSMIASGTTKDISSSFSSVSAIAPITLQIDIHNDESPVHMLAWTGSVYTETAAAFNSEESGNESPGNGMGQYWGLVLAGAKVTNAVVGDAKFSD